MVFSGHRLREAISGLDTHVYRVKHEEPSGVDQVVCSLQGNILQWSLDREKKNYYLGRFRKT